MTVPELSLKKAHYLVEEPSTYDPAARTVTQMHGDGNISEPSREASGPPWLRRHGGEIGSPTARVADRRPWRHPKWCRSKDRHLA